MIISKSTKPTIKIDALLLASFVIEAANENLPIYKLRKIAPKSEYEHDLFNLLKQYPPLLSYAVYLFFKKIEKIKPNEKNKTNFDLFFINLECVYLLKVALDTYGVPEAESIKKFKGLYALGKRYAMICEHINTYLNKEQSKGSPSVENLSSQLRGIKHLTIAEDINQFMREFFEIKKEYYPDDFFKQEITDAYGLLYKEACSILEAPEIKKTEDKEYPFLISIFPPLWASSEMNIENIISSFLIKKISPEHSIINENKNLFYYFLLSSKRQRQELLADKITEMFAYKDIRSKDILNQVDLLFTTKEKEKVLDNFITFSNKEQIRTEMFTKKLLEIFSIDLSKEYTETEITAIFIAAIHRAGMLFSSDENAFLFYASNLAENKEVVGLLAEKIENILSNNLIMGEDQ